MGVLRVKSWNVIQILIHTIFILDKVDNFPQAYEPPLVVDLDGTLIHTDILYESVIHLIRNKPYFFLALPYWLLRGRAFLKQKLASLIKVDIKLLPFNAELIAWLSDQRDCGRRLVLCTASDKTVAKDIAAYLMLFDEVIASDGVINLSGKNKATALNDKFGYRLFDYVGNSLSDLWVWESSRMGVVVDGSVNLITKVKSMTKLEYVFIRQNNAFMSWMKALRIHQWVKNLLIFIPIFAAHQSITPELWRNLLLAFFSFSLCASSVYIVNDLLDLESDRQHPRKRDRSFASGKISIWKGILMSPVLIITGLACALHVGGNFLPWLLIYFGLTCCYSWGLKKLVLVDCLILAILYTLRILAGASSVNVPLSFWLLTFSIFLFLSLAFIKRYAELKTHQDSDGKKAHGRGYYTSDNYLIEQLGVSSGYAATLVLALYLNSENVTRLYKTPEIIWGAVPLMFLWISWMWLQAHRGFMHDDPIIFAIKDWASICIGGLFVATFVLARIW
jgi:4-hydroxybenzoate polyprenyltransferase